MSFNLPTEQIELPSKGLVYPESSPLSSGKIEMKYMTAKEEDILTNANYIADGTVLDRLMKSLIVSNINYDELIVGDKNAIMIAARILGYGKDYSFNYAGTEQTVDLTTLENKEINESIYTRGNNEFEFELPQSGNKVTFKLLTHKDEQDINKELDALKKLNKEGSAELTTRLRFMITSVNGDNQKSTINDFVNNYLLAQDSRALREHISSIQPDVDLTFFPSGSKIKRSLPLGVNFFWPDSNFS
jgi:hypothetical protein